MPITSVSGANARVRDIAIDPVTNRFVLAPNADLTLATGGVAVAQAVKQKLGLWLGEWFLDTTKGVDWAGVIFAKGTSKARIAQMLRDQIEEVPGVTVVLTMSIDIDPASRSMRVDFTAGTDFGELDVTFTATFGGV